MAGLLPNVLSCSVIQSIKLPDEYNSANYGDPYCDQIIKLRVLLNQDAGFQFDYRENRMRNKKNPGRQSYAIN